MTRVGAMVAAVPTFSTLIVNVLGAPTAKVPVCCMAIARSIIFTGVVSESVLLAPVGSAGDRRR